MTARRPRPGRFGPRPAALAACCLVLAACTQTPLTTPDGMTNPRDVALVCVDPADPSATLPFDECPADSRVRAFITAGRRGSVAIANPNAPSWVDTDKSIPGYTPVLLGGLPRQIHRGVDEALYVSMPVDNAVQRLEPGPLARTTQPLDFSPAGVVTVGGTTPRLLITDPAGGRLWQLDLDAFGMPEAASPIDVGGSPHVALWHEATDGVYVGHLEHAHVTILDGATLAVRKRLPLGPACADGVDNDGDGLTDTADPGCGDREDRDEGEEAAPPACADGVDNDGDGLTDFPDDPGCLGYGDASEWSDNPTCADGIDNNGDGTTDAADPLCATGDREGATPSDNVIGPCNDGLDNDGDGLVDHPADPDCSAPTDTGELSRACANGVDDDGDGLTDLDDDACDDRSAPSEVATDRAPQTQLAMSFGGGWIAATHRQRRLVVFIDPLTESIARPGDEGGPVFPEVSPLDIRRGADGLTLGQGALAIAPVMLPWAVAVDDGAGDTTTEEGQAPAFALTRSLGGLVVVRTEIPEAVDPDGDGAETLSLDPGFVRVATSRSGGAAIERPSLAVADDRVDIGAAVPSVWPTLGPLKVDRTDPEAPVFYGMRLLEDETLQRTQLWDVTWEGLVPGSERATASMASPTVLHDPQADFCALGVVAGDWLVIDRRPPTQPDASVPDCTAGGSTLSGEVLRYRIAEVGPDTLTIEPGSGQIDAPVTPDNQATWSASDLIAAPEPPAGCLPDAGVRYHVRSSAWLVQASTDGLLSRRERVGNSCAALDPDDPLQRARMQQAAPPSPSLEACPVVLEQLPDDARFPFDNGIFQAEMAPGCAPGPTAEDPSTLLPTPRETRWRFLLNGPTRVRTTNVGAHPVSLQSGPTLENAYVVDQGAGALYVVDIARGIITDSLQ